MQHSFDVTIAENFGVDEAIFLKNLSYWIKFNHDSNQNFHDGRYWMYNTHDAFTKWFSYWSVKQMRRVIKSCIAQGLVLEGAHNAHAYDKTKWYALSNEGLKLLIPTIFPNGQMDAPKWADGKSQMGRPIPNEIPNEIPNIKSSCASDDDAIDRFDEFWIHYPKKKDKLRTKKVWKRLQLDKKADMIIADIENRKKNDHQWQDPQYIPHPSTYLSGERWEDEIVQPSPQTKPGTHEPPVRASKFFSADDYFEKATERDRIHQGPGVKHAKIDRG